MMMTREDMMRELELLPVWQSRAPAANVESKPDPIVQLVVEATKDGLETIEKLAEISTSVSMDTPIFTHIASEDGEYLFVLPSVAMSAEELLLFQNICKALRIKIKPAVTSSDILTVISDTQTKLLLVMSEAVAQIILQSMEPIAQLRGKPHQLHGVALVATYDLSYLLQNPADKAKVWRDLCMGLQISQDLKVTNS
jgi:uracil-DNA glycosylase